MRNLFLSTLFILLSALTVYSQDKTTSLIEQGVILYDKGDYRGAVKKYEEALKIDSKNTTALYEASMTYINLKEYDKAIEFCDKLIAIGGKTMMAYVNKATALDLMGNDEQAITVYKEGIKLYPDEYMLHFNLGITYIQNKMVLEAEKEMLESLDINPEHPSSNFVLGYIQYIKEDKVRTMLTYYYFLMLEPTSKRSNDAFVRINEMMNHGVEKESDNKININISADRDTTDPFYTADFYFTLKAATMFTEEFAKKSAFEKFYSYTEDVVKFLDEKVGGEKKNFYVYLYARFLKGVYDAKLLETYCYNISQSAIPESAKWVKKNPDKIEQLYEWFEKFTSGNRFRNDNPIKIDPNEKKKRR